MLDLIKPLFALAISFPTVIFTVLLGLIVVYWLFSAVTGGTGVDEAADGLLDGAADGILEGAADGILEGAADGVLEGAADGLMEGAADGLMEGAADGVLEGAADGALEGVADGAADGALDGVADGGADGAAAALGHGHAGCVLGKLLGCLGFTAVPVTLIGTILVSITWAICLGFSHLVAGFIGVATLGLLAGGAVLIGASVVGLGLTSLAVRPLKKVFTDEDVLRRRQLVGKVCTIRTGTVDADFGQAEYDDGQAGLLIDVRCTRDADALGRGDQALIFEYDPKNEVFRVIPITSSDPPVGKDSAETIDSGSDSDSQPPGAINQQSP